MVSLHVVVDDRRRSVPICDWVSWAVGFVCGVVVSVVAYFGPGWVP